MFVDVPALPPSITSGEVPVVCIAYAAATFELSPTLIVATLKTEGGRVGMERRNANGTADLGPGQINEIWLPILKRHGIDRASVRDDGCLNVWVLSWIMRSGINSTGNYWRGVGRYHSATMRPGRDLNGAYAARVWNQSVGLTKLEASWWGIPGLNSMITTTSLSTVADLLVAESGRQRR